MELIVRVGEQEEKVEIEALGQGFRVVVGAKTYHVERVASGPGRHSLLVAGEQREVSVLAENHGRYWVESRDGGVEVEVVDPLTYLASTAKGEKGRGTAQVTAYMPGRVVDVLVAEGDVVKAGQGLVVLEAMKMENEIQAEHDGVIKRVCVAPGQAVEGGDVLFELE
jgi:glutaconyl-CoA/methylmalonyl-CoA decarboxylase subunit gamma